MHDYTHRHRDTDTTADTGRKTLTHMCEHTENIFGIVSGAINITSGLEPF